jgi:hypothetical protein
MGGDRAVAIGSLTAMPIAAGIVVGIILHHIGVPDVVCLAAGAAIAVPGAITVFVLLMRYLRKQDD